MQTPTLPSRYIRPATPTTGGTGQQPAANTTRSDWYFDVHLNYQQTGFLDAVDRVPTGSHRGVDCGTITIGRACRNRPGALA